MAGKNMPSRDMTPVLAGYMPKRTMRGEEWMKDVPFLEVCSVSCHMSIEPEGWIDLWIHNELWLFDTMALARSIVPPADLPSHDLYAFRMFPWMFREGERLALEFPEVEAEPMDAAFEFLGHDAANKTFTPQLECSPLSCNYMWQQAVVNQWCLVNDLEPAVDLARRFSIEKPEPGDYYVVEVWRHRARDSWWRDRPA